MCAVKTVRTVRVLFIAMAVAASLAVTRDARAQTRVAADQDWRHGTTLAAFAGAASPFSGVDPALGLSLGWEVTPRLGVEGRSTWFPAADGVNAFAAAIGAHVGFQTARPFLPFAAAGVGLYRAVFDAPLRTPMPRFYERRLNGAGERSRTFDDFMVSFGGGAEVFVSRHVALRPELTVMLVTTRSDVRAVPQLGVHLIYHFESHPITP